MYIFQNKLETEFRDTLESFLPTGLYFIFWQICQKCLPTIRILNGHVSFNKVYVPMKLMSYVNNLESYIIHIINLEINWSKTSKPFTNFQQRT